MTAIDDIYDSYKRKLSTVEYVSRLYVLYSMYMSKEVLHNRVKSSYFAPSLFWNALLLGCTSMFVLS